MSDHWEQQSQELVFGIFEEWLKFLDSDDGRAARAKRSDDVKDWDLACLVPTPPTQSIVTVGDLRLLVDGIRELRRLRLERGEEEVEGASGVRRRIFTADVLDGCVREGGSA